MLWLLLWKRAKAPQERAPNIVVPLTEHRQLLIERRYLLILLGELRFKLRDGRRRIFGMERKRESEQNYYLHGNNTSLIQTVTLPALIELTLSTVDVSARITESVPLKLVPAVTSVGNPKLVTDTAAFMS